jgi:hypothetical protein
MEGNATQLHLRCNLLLETERFQDKLEALYLSGRQQLSGQVEQS